MTAVLTQATGLGSMDRSGPIASIGQMSDDRIRRVLSNAGAIKAQWTRGVPLVRRAIQRAQSEGKNAGEAQRALDAWVRRLAPLMREIKEAERATGELVPSSSVELRAATLSTLRSMASLAARVAAIAGGVFVSGAVLMQIQPLRSAAVSAVSALGRAATVPIRETGKTLRSASGFVVSLAVLAGLWFLVKGR